MRKYISLVVFVLMITEINGLFAQPLKDSSLLTIDRIFLDHEFTKNRLKPLHWIDNGNSYLTLEPAENRKGIYELVRFDSKSGRREIFISADELTPEGGDQPLVIENFSFSDDESKVLIFTNSKRVWRSNTKGDFWVFDRKERTLKKLGKDFPPSSLMFAKFSKDNRYVAYVHDFNLYKENFKTGEVTQLTFDGNGKIINGTFDWVYEEEFGCRDGFRWSDDGKNIAFWQLDASKIGTFYMINNTDSVYSKVIPIQYPKAGYDPSSCKVGYVEVTNGRITWIPVPGDPVQHYIPAMQWLDDHRLLIQQLNRKQNELNIYVFDLSDKNLKKIYTETEKTWVDLTYPDVTAQHWGDNDLPVVDKGKAVLRMTENDGWRHVHKIDIENGEIRNLTPGSYDVASVCRVADKKLYLMASPSNTAERYLYSVGMNGKGDTVSVTPAGYDGVSLYNISPNGKFAVHTFTSVNEPGSADLITLPGHRVLRNLMNNEALKKKLAGLQLPKTGFFTVTTRDGLEIPGRMILPAGFDSTKKYPVLFHVYGEPWGQVAVNSWIGMWNIMLAQQGYIIIDMDNRGTPCLLGSEWRKSIYGKVGIINSHDQAMAAAEVLKWDFIDTARVAVWGWSGGGSMTLNLMFRYLEIYKTGMAVAAVTNELIYDNIYQERYMGLPQENMEGYIEGSPVTYAKNLKGNLLLVHGTGDDNVHYQGEEMLINELIKYNKLFSFMPYPNRSHGIYEGKNTRRHLYTLLTRYLNDHCEPGGK